MVVLAAGFDHVSDDDFARVTIAQRFAVAPHLDPTGTSWLPFPFWVLGAAMSVFGRTLGVARVTSITLASVAAALPYLAVRKIGVGRTRAIVAVAFTLLSPWSLWLGASTTPESMTASATAAAAIAIGGGLAARAMLPYAALLACACLSRYEPWPVAAVLGVTLAMRFARDEEDRHGTALVLALSVAAPLAWMAWNAHVHDGPLHFFRRVAGYKRAIGEGATDTLSALEMYPRLLLTTRPDVVLGAGVALASLGRTNLRKRWLVPLACAFLQIAFLSYGNARDGAPAHHPERALLGATTILALFAGDVLFEALPRARRLGLAAASVIAAAWLVAARPLLKAPPGSSPSEDRRAQIERGHALAASGAASLVLTPCAYEHFALIAAYGAPERADVRPASGAPVTAACPEISSARP